MRLRIELETDDGRVIGASRPIIVSSTPLIEFKREAARMVADIERTAFQKWGTT